MIRKVLVAATVIASGFFVLTGQPPAVFTAAQATAGRTAYLSTCVTCHTETLIPAAGAKLGEQVIPPLAGADFMARWGARTTSHLSGRIKDAVGGFPPKERDEKTHLNLAAYILQVNGARPGTQELTAATAVTIQAITVPPEAGADRR